MTAPTLPTTLARLAELLPQRVKVTPPSGLGEARYAHVLPSPQLGWQYVYYTTPTAQGWASHDLGGMFLEAALRKECEARGWFWVVERTDWPDGDYRAALSRLGWSGRVGYADTPAHALALALIQALEAGQ